MKANNELVLEGVSYLFIISKFRRNLSLYRPRVHCGQHSTSLKKWDATNNQLTLQYRGLILECVKLVGVRQRQVAVGAVKAETVSAPIPCISGTLLGILSISSKLLTKRWSSFKGQGQVDVLDKGYAYDGRLFTSLTPIAKAITGSHRSGPHFFGVSQWSVFAVRYIQESPRKKAFSSSLTPCMHREKLVKPIYTHRPEKVGLACLINMMMAASQVGI